MGAGGAATPFTQSNSDVGPRGQNEAPTFSAPPALLDVFVRGLPVTQGSMTQGRNGGIKHQKDDELMRWRGLIWGTVREAWALRPTLEVPTIVDLDFYVMTKGRRLLFRAPNGLYHAAGIGRDDLDKLIRAVLDALTTAKLWTDDSLAVEIHARKYYAAPPDTPPGVAIRVRQALTPYSRLNPTALTRRPKGSDR